MSSGRVKVWVHLKSHAKINDFQTFAAVKVWNPAHVQLSLTALSRRRVYDSDVAHVSFGNGTVGFSFVRVLP